MMIALEPIGTVRSLLGERGRVPEDAEATLEISSKFRDGLDGLEDLDRIDVIWYGHLSRKALRVIPMGRVEFTGVFATRSPDRPNPILITTVEVLSVDIDKGEVKVRGLDALDDSPILDIKQTGVLGS